MHETTNRCNGHIQVSSPAGKAPKRDRKGCKRGKIEAIMKNSMGSTKPKAHIDSIFKKKTKLLNTLNRFSGGNVPGDGGGISFGGITAGSIIKNEIIDDPYTFTDCEPQTPQTGVGLYLTSGVNSLIGSGCLSSIRKEPPHLNNTNHLSHQNQSNTNSSINCSVSGSSNCINSISKSSGNNSKKINVNTNINGNVQVLKSGDCKSESTNNYNNISNKSNANISNINHSNVNKSTSVNVHNKAVTGVPLKQQHNVNNNNNLCAYNKTVQSSSNSGNSGCLSRNNGGSGSNISNSSSNGSSNGSNPGGCGGMGGNNGIIDGSSKTMNKLQAEIARNKVIIKRRRVICQQSSLSSGGHDLADSDCGNGSYGVIKSEPNATVQGKYQPQQQLQRTFARVSIPAKRLHRQTTWQRERRIRHEALQRIQDAQLEAASVKTDLFPLGLDASDSEDDDFNNVDIGDDEVYQRHWFMGCGNDYQSPGFSIRGRETRMTLLRSELRRRLRQVWHGIEKGGDPPPLLVNAVVTAARTQPAATAMLITPHHILNTNNHKFNKAKVSMLEVKQCSFCQRKALPCTRHCVKHIMYNIDQQLFHHCSWKSDDRLQQCRVPVFDIAHPAPLCPQHARKQDNSVKTLPDASSKKSRKKSKTSTLTRSAKRGKKKKKKPSVVVASDSGVSNGVVSSSNVNSNNDNNNSNNNNNINSSSSSSSNNSLEVIIEPKSISDIVMTSSSPSSITTEALSGTTGNLIQSMVTGSTNTVTTANIMVSGINDVIERRRNDLLSSSSMTPSSVSSVSSTSPCIPISQVEVQVQLEDVVEEVPEEVLAIASLDPAELASQASRLLEDQDLTNMLNIPADAFNDLFTEDKNGEYEPTREETEELERALEAVDNDVRSLERLTRSMPALPLTLPLETMTTLLDDPNVTSAIPGVYAGVGYPNGFASSVQTDLRHS